MKKLSFVIIKLLVVSSIALLIVLVAGLNIFLRNHVKTLARERIRESLPMIAEEVMVMMQQNLPEYKRRPEGERRPSMRSPMMHSMAIRVYDSTGDIVRVFPKTMNDNRFVKITEEPFPLQDGLSMDVYIRNNMVMNERERDFIMMFLWYSGFLIIILTIVFILVARHISRRITNYLNRQKNRLLAIAGGNYRLSIDPEYEEFLALKTSVDAMSERLQSEETRKKDFITNFSHDIRTPLTVIRGTVEGVGDGLIPINEKTVSGILSEIHRIEQLASKARDFDLQRGIVEHVSLKDTVLRVAKKYSLMAVTVDGDDIILELEKGDLERIADNILSNAMKYNSKSVKTCNITVGREKIFAVLKFRDNGDGIAREHLPLVFEKFYREDSARSVVQGSGLGLAIVREIVTKYDGKVEARSEKSVYTEIVITLPCTY